MDYFLSLSILGYCCVLEGHHNFPRPTSEQRPRKALLSSAQGKGHRDEKGSRVEGELPLQREQQPECWVTAAPVPLLLSQALAVTATGGDGAAVRQLLPAQRQAPRCS